MRKNGVRRRWLAVLAVVLLAVAGAGWAWLKPSDPNDEAIDAAIGRVALAGGPPGWDAGDFSPAFSGNGLTALGADAEKVETTKWETRRGLRVAIDNNLESDVGFAALWTLPAAQATAENCDALTGWMSQFVAVEAAGIRSGCRAAAGKPVGDTSIVASAASVPAADGTWPDGRYLAFVQVGPDDEGREALIAILRYEAPDPALRD